ncbi:SDR family oxidoreductase [Algihabitans albus]|uniref:SDR family oxidoreductase n=1 Tax=Algihabitans albus TaxID=2164067 RepID=UPI000E5D1ABD|nr:SDR family oxidoreductase [Algihabitans albus]
MPTALITGANRGLGLELARSIAAEGWQVHSCCRMPDKAPELRATADAADGRIQVHRLDVTDDLQVRSLARSLEGKPLDLLFNNAGIYGPRDGFGSQDFEAWSKVLAINLMAPMRMVENFVELVAASQHKLIVNMSSRLGSISENDAGGGYPYRSSKAALNMVTRGLSVDLAPRGITVVSVHPGWVQTDMGGSDAALTVADSVAGLRRVMEKLTPEDSGRFFDHSGAELPW